MAEISTNELRDKFLAFFKSVDHAIIPSAPLKPENDPSVLFTTAGMHPLVPYLKGEIHPQGQRLANAQKCLRTTDIEEVGDSTHATVFEMLGNWSLGDYFKTEAITWSWEFLTDSQWLSLNPQHIAVSVFGGNEVTSRDEESAAIWKGLGVPEERIAYLGVDDNWWPAGGKHVGPQGPDTEIFYWTGQESPPQKFDPADKRWVEIWNNVFMQFNRLADGSLSDLPQQNVDTGMGLERTVMVLNGMQSIYEIDSFRELLAMIDGYMQVSDERSRRILADHIKAATFMLGDKDPIVPSNKDQGYVLRRVIRRAVMALRDLGINGRDQSASEVLRKGAEIMIKQYGQHYSSLEQHRELILTELKKEVDRFDTAIDKGLVELNRILSKINADDVFQGKVAFDLYQTHGLPVEMTAEVVSRAGARMAPDAMEVFHSLMARHQEQSRAAAAGKFKGGLADHSEQSVRYHTATHLLHQALRDVLGEHVLQRGSNITPERLRFDFSHSQKLTADEKAQIESIVNQQIAANLPVDRSVMSVTAAKSIGALGVFEDRYDDEVSVYSIGDYSKEICGGPHVTATGQLGRFKILKEEAASAGVRRIKAVLE